MKMLITSLPNFVSPTNLKKKNEQNLPQFKS